MARKRREASCCPDGPAMEDGCRVEAIVPVDERGQMVLPKELRDKAGIAPGDKLALTTWVKDGKVCCIVMVKADDLVDMVKDRLGPVMKEINK